jgi:hypothetical protein
MFTTQGTTEGVRSWVAIRIKLRNWYANVLIAAPIYPQYPVILSAAKDLFGGPTVRIGSRSFAALRMTYA